MAFLCPVRIRRGKKKKSSSGDIEAPQSSGNTFTGLGRITGSASIETLVRVGLEKENGLSPDSKMVVLHDFTPCVDDELQVKKGQIVNILYRENDWVYVISEDSRLEGFIPLSYCTLYNSHLGELALHNFKKKLPRDHNSNDVNIDIHKGHNSDSENSIKKELNQNQVQPNSSPNNSHGSTSQADMNHFMKDPSGRFIVLYSFVAGDENDVSVERGDFVTVLNREDPDWYWIVRSDGQEGFVPSGFVYPADVLQKMTSNLASNSNNVTTGTTNSSSNPAVNTVPANPIPSNLNEESRCHGTELVMLYDYKAQASDDLSIRRGDWIYADMNNQTVDGWLWAYAPKTKKYGFVPKVYARPPAMTSL